MDSEDSEVRKKAYDMERRIYQIEDAHLGKMMESIRKGVPPQDAMEKAKGSYGRFADAAKYVDPRKE